MTRGSVACQARAVGLPILQRAFEERYAVDWQQVFEKARPDMSTAGTWVANDRSGSTVWQTRPEQSGCTFDIAITAYSHGGRATDGITVVVG